MMSEISVALDSNVIIRYFRDRDACFDKLLAQSYCVPRVVVGELYAGAFKSARPRYHQEKIERFLKNGRVLEVNDDTSLEYGGIWASLASVGQMIPTNDIWIAALALQHKMPLVSNDSHFEKINGLILENW